MTRFRAVWATGRRRLRGRPGRRSGPHDPVQNRFSNPWRTRYLTIALVIPATRPQHAH